MDFPAFFFVFFCMLREWLPIVSCAGHITSKRTYSERHTPSFAYKITNRQALDVLSQIVGHLRTYRSGTRTTGTWAGYAR